MNDSFSGNEDGRTASNAREKVREKVADAAEGAKQQARTQYDRKKNAAVGEIDNLASALRRAGGELGESGGVSGRFVSMVADRLESFGRSIEGKDLDQVFGDVERLARRNPAAFIGGAVAIGFLASRFLKSSGRPSASGMDFETDPLRSYGASTGRDFSSEPITPVSPRTGTSSVGVAGDRKDFTTTSADELPGTPGGLNRGGGNLP